MNDYQIMLARTKAAARGATPVESQISVQNLQPEYVKTATGIQVLDPNSGEYLLYLFLGPHLYQEPARG